VDIIKVDRDVAIVVHVCCKCLSQRFICFFNTYVVSVSDAYLKCFICFLLYVASVVSGCFKCRSGCYTCCNVVSTVCLKCSIISILDTCCKCFYLDVTKIDLAFECCSETHLPHPPACNCWGRIQVCGSRGARAAGADRGMYGKRSNVGLT
jgi:hypothetical protein